MTPPYGPVAISLDAGIQQEPVKNNGEKLYIPRYVPTSPPQGDTGAVKEAAKLLVNAAEPGDRRRSRGAHAERRPASGATGRTAAGPGDRPGRPDELPADALSQPPAHRGQQCRRDHRAGAHRLLGRRQSVRRQRRTRHRHQHDPGQARHQADQHQLGRSQHQGELPGLPALPGGRHPDGGGRGSDAAGADRSRALGDPERSQGGDREARRGRQEGLCGGPGADQAGGRAGLGCEPDQHRAAGDGNLRPDQGPRLVAGRVDRQRQQLAPAAVADGEAPPLARPLRRLWRRLRRAGLDRCRARQPRPRPVLGLASRPTAT